MNNSSPSSNILSELFTFDKSRATTSPFLNKYEASRFAYLVNPSQASIIALKLDFLNSKTTDCG